MVSESRSSTSGMQSYDIELCQREGLIASLSLS